MGEVGPEEFKSNFEMFGPQNNGDYVAINPDDAMHVEGFSISPQMTYQGDQIRDRFGAPNYILVPVGHMIMDSRIRPLWPMVTSVSGLAALAAQCFEATIRFQHDGMFMAMYDQYRTEGRHVYNRVQDRKRRDS